MNILHVFHRDWPYGGSVTLFDTLKKYSRFNHTAVYAERDTGDANDYQTMKRDFEHIVPQIKEVEPDIVVAHFFYAAFKAHENRMRTALLSHCMVSEEYRLAINDTLDSVERARLEAAYQECRRDEETLYRQIGNIITVSRFHQREIERMNAKAAYAIPPLDLCLFPEIDIRSETRKMLDLEEEFTLVFLARPTYLKGLHVVQDAVKDFLKTDLQLILVGDYGWRDGEVSYTPAIGVHKKERVVIQFPRWVKTRVVGRIPRKEIHRIYKAADVTLCPSLYEALGYVNLESLASERPVIGSNSGGIPEIVKDGETGFLFTVGDPEDLAKKISTLIGDPGLCNKMGKQGRITAQAFEASEAVNTFDHLLERVADGDAL